MSLILLCFMCLPIRAGEAAALAWMSRVNGITETKINCILQSSHDQPYIFVGTDRGLYRASGVAGTFSPVLQLFGNEAAINHIIRDENDTSTLYVGTDTGIFESKDGGRNWNAIYSPSNPTARRVYAVAMQDDTIFAATADGLYIRAANDWQKSKDEFGREAVYRLATDDIHLYIATAREVYRIADDETMKIYTAPSVATDEEEFDEDGELIEKPAVRNLKVHQGSLYLVTNDNILKSDNAGSSWARFSIEGLESERINDFVMDASEPVYAATDEGFLIKGEKITLKYADIAQSFVDEPSINDVQSMAIEYANVNPRQINSWHNQARAKALLPSLSVGFARADTELYHWDTGGNPDILRKGSDYLDWSTSLAWDFSDFVWSSDRTSIDSRAKSMSDLRQDILDQVTRLYFERRRIQAELASLEESDLDREIRVEELTALIDGLTGGEFSRRVDKDSPVRKK